MSNENAAASQLRAFVERAERLNGEKTAINQDLSELFKEMKGEGFDTKVVKAIISDRAKDPNKKSEFDALYDLYAEALGMVVATRAPAQGHDEDGVFPDDEPQLDGAAQAELVRTSAPAPVESVAVVISAPINEPRNPAPQESAQMQENSAELDAVDASLASAAGQEGIVDRQPIQPEMANEAPHEPTIGGLHESAAHPVPVNLDRRQQNDAPTVGQDDSEHQRVEHIETNIAPAGRAADESPATNVTTLRQPKPLRPNCLKPEMCGGQGRNHCWACTKAMNEVGAA